MEYVLITGASSGIGEAIARRIGASTPLILHGRDADRLETVREGGPHLPWVHDLAGEPDLAGFLAERGATVTSFIHCAGEFRIAPVTAADPATVLREFQTNFFSASAIVRALIRKNVNHGALRSVVLVSSIASRFGAKGYSVYAATKGALDSLARSLAAELAPVRINTILPGGIRTRGTEFLYAGDTASEAAKGYLLGEGGPNDIAAMAEFLISDAARWITGQHFVVDGGKTAH